MFQFPYILIKRRLIAEVPALKEVAWEMNQGRPGYKGAILVTPALYIKFRTTNTNSLGKGIQEANLEFETRLVTDCVADVDKRIFTTTPGYHLELASKVHAALSNYSAWLSDLDEFADIKDTGADIKILNTIDRISISPDHMNEAKIETTQLFKVYTKDYTGTKHFQKLVKDLLIEDLQILT